MKRFVSVVAIITFISCWAPPAFCGRTEMIMTDALEGMWVKLTRGAVNLCTGWLELPVQMVKGYQKSETTNPDRKILGVCEGFWKGIFHSLGRTVWGAVEVVGFWTANPEDNVGIGYALDGPYVWHDTDLPIISSDLDTTPLDPYGRKFVRGIENTLFGAAEFPGQVARGVRDKSWDFGISKGLWYWASRELYGIADLVTVILPVPADNPGFAFEQEHPWDALTDVLEQ